MVDEYWDVFLSHAHADAAFVLQLAEDLHALGLRVFLDVWEIGFGDVLVHRLDKGLRESKTGVLVVSKASVSRPWVMQEYAVLLANAVERGQRLIPVVIEAADLPAMLCTRLWVDLRSKSGADYRKTVEGLARAIRGERPKAPGRD